MNQLCFKDISRQLFKKKISKVYFKQRNDKNIIIYIHAKCKKIYIKYVMIKIDKRNQLSLKDISRRVYSRQVYLSLKHCPLSPTYAEADDA